MDASTTIETTGSIISKLDTEIIKIKFKNDAHVTLDEAIEIADSTIKVCGNQKFLLLIDATEIYGIMDPDAMDYFTNDERLVGLRMAQAMVVDNLPIRLFANIYMRVKKPAGEVKIFGNIDEAIAWLSELRHLVSKS